MKNLIVTGATLFKRIFPTVLAALMLNSASCANKQQDLPEILRSLPQSMALDGDGGGVSADSNLSPAEKGRLLLEHNRARAEVGADPLAWSEALAAYAQQWADHLAGSGCRMEHRPTAGAWRGIYGENLFMGTAGHYGVVDAVWAWESEKGLYQGKALTPENWQPAGHYTQMVWKNTREIGCGKVECQGRVIIVCNYDPPGNVLGERPY